MTRAAEKIAKAATDLWVSIELARRYASNSHAANTKRAYRLQWIKFVDWCAERKLPPFPATGETVAMYIAARAAAGVPAATIDLDLTAINQAHKANDLPGPRDSAEVKAVRRGIRRQHGTEQVQKEALSVEQLQKLADSMFPPGQEDSPISADVRDRALLLVAFASGMRRSELVALNLSDVKVDPQGVRLRIARSKTDQEGHGRTVGILRGEHARTCPVLALDDWMQLIAGRKGPLFRSVDRWGHVRAIRLHDRDVARILKRRLKAVGIKPKNYAGHSLRAGLVTAAHNAGHDALTIQKQTGHASAKQLERYIRESDLFRTNATRRIGL